MIVYYLIRAVVSMVVGIWLGKDLACKGTIPNSTSDALVVVYWNDSATN